MSATLTSLIEKLPTVRRRIPTATNDSPASLAKGGIYILPTRQGLIFFTIIFVMLLAAINYNNSMTYALSFMLAGVAVISMFHTYLNLVELTIQPDANSACFAGEEGNFTLRVGDSAKRERLQIYLSLPDGERSVKDIAAENYIQYILSKNTESRGRISLGRITVSSQYPLNLFRAWSYVEPESHIIVYPKPNENSKNMPFGQGSGDRQETSERGSDDFHGLNTYQRGDSPRHIHWKSWAQGRDLVTKQFHRNRSTELWLEWDLVDARDVEERLSQLCRWVLDADARGQAYGLRIPGTEIHPARGEQHRHQCLSALALFGENA